MKKLSLYACLLCAVVLFTTACSNDSDTTGGNEENYVGPGPYIITAAPKESEGVADYILTAETLSKGKISLVGNGIEQDGTYRYYITNNNKFFSLLYGQGDPGAVTTYELNDDYSLEKLSDFQSETVQSFTNVDDEVLMTKISRNAESPVASWYRLDTNKSIFVGNGEINTAELTPEGEQAFFTWMTQVGDKVYAPFMSVKACCNDAFGTDYPDQAWIAVYSYPEMELETIIHDDRTSFIGRYFTSGLEVDENGDAYAFSSSVATNNGEATSTKPSAITKIDAGTTTFDESYYFNLEEASNGYYETAQKYAGNGKFLLLMAPQETKGAYVLGTRLALVDVYAKSFTWVTGMPSESDITSVTRNNYTSEDGTTVSIGVNTNNGNYIYNIDINNASATQGLKVEGGSITAISKLDPAQE